MRNLASFLGVFALLHLTACPARAINCAGTSTGRVPLTDLGTGTYLGAQGGLYPGGLNGRPAAHDAAGISIANAIAPLDTLGQPDPNGRVVFISIGMSNCTQEFSTFVPKANADPLKKTNVLVVDCAQGGQAADVIRDPNAPYWDFVATRLRLAGSSPLQAQVVWIKQANRNPKGGFDASRDTLTWNMGTIVRIIHDKLPNVRLCYLTSRIYAGYADTPLNPEPYAYESGFAFKNLIAAQIAGEDSLEYAAANGPVESPWLSWGPYLWADGLTPRSDGMTWACGAFANDGTHPGPTGRNVVADSLLAFVHADATAIPWYLRVPTGLRAGEFAALDFRVSPNPARGGAELRFTAGEGEPWRADVVDAAGRLLRALGAGAGGTRTIRWDARDQLGRAAPAGVYWVRLTIAGRAVTRRLVLLEGPPRAGRE